MLETYQLRNGMKVILWPTKKSPVVTVQAWVRTGSADERPGEEGISHFIEHLLFKGTRKYKVGEIASIIEGSGGELNAYTSFDQTVFHITISKQYTDVAIDTLNEMIGYPQFDATEIDNEREVVIEEIKRSNDNPHRQASRLLFEGVYKKHPYKKPVIGYEQNIRDFSREDILSYYNSRYVPKNISLVIVGDFETKKLKHDLENSFSKIKPFVLRKSTRQQEDKSKQTTINVLQAPFQETIVHTAWRVPGAKHNDTPALDLLALVLGQGDSSRLSYRVRINSAIANYVGAHVYSPQDEGFFAVSAGLSLENMEAYLTEIGEEILQIQLEGVTQKEIDKALSIFEADEIYGVETVDGLARKLGSFELLFNKPDYYKNYLLKLSKVTPKQILDVARKYLRPKTMTVAVLTPEKQEQANQSAQKWAFDFALAQDALRKAKPESQKTNHRSIKIEELKSSNRANPIAKNVLPSGSKVILAPNHQAPTVSIRLAFRGGQRLETKQTQGVSELLTNTWLAGTSKNSENDLLEKMDALAMGVRPFSGRNTIGLSLTTLTANLDKAFEIFNEVLSAPLFAKEAVERERQVMLEGIKQKKDNPAQIAIQNFQEIIFEGHPYALDAAGTEETVKTIKRENLVSIYEKSVNNANFTVVCAGDFNKKFGEKLTQVLTNLRGGQAIDDKFAVRKITEAHKKFEKLEKEQTHIIYGMRGLNLYDEERHALQVLQSVLAGQGGRLFLELRDKASLAYSVSPLQTEGLEVGYFGAYIGCSPEKGTRALEMLEIEFSKLAQSKISEVELERAQKYLIGRHDIGLQKNSALASAILFEEIYGLQYTNVFSYAEKIRSITTDDVLRLGQRLFSEKKIITAVGPIQPW